MHVTAIIAAGGRGRRFGGAVPKQLTAVAGRSILERSVAAFIAHPQVDEIIVALPAEIAVDPPAYLLAGPKRIHVVAGGDRRQDSVFNALQAVGDHSDLVLVHDAARPFASADLIARTIAAAAESGAALPALPARDTIKRVGILNRGDTPPNLVVQETLPRDAVVLAQTPQAFRREILRDGFSRGQEGGEATDEASLVERAGHRVRIVEGESTNIKITTPEDLAAAELMLRPGGDCARDRRAGTGFDLHRLVDGRPLVVGGVLIASDRGAAGHSDADVACHAIADAVLGAAALGDIGRHFPDTDPRWKDASSLDLLARIAALVTAEGYEVINVDCTVILQAPKIGAHIEAMRAAVAGALGIGASHVSIKAKTNEGVDAVGRGEAIGAHAVALVAVRN
jgi:2-C-methyl-D-erythritol 4-phosphate cytidylyltransferase/2-C-methyl-D-erythritol 2,4-cyclodiphosphate synthase